MNFETILGTAFATWLISHIYYSSQIRQAELRTEERLQRFYANRVQETAMHERNQRELERQRALHESYWGKYRVLIYDYR